MRFSAKVPAILAAVSLLATASQGGAAISLSVDAGVDLSWPTVTGNTYQLQWAPDAAGPWTDLGAALAGNGQSASYHDPLRAGRRQYRVEVTVPGAPVSALQNGGFESGSGTSADDWTTGAASPPTRSDSDARSGAFCMHANLVNVGAAPTEGVLFQTAPVTGGQVYDLSFWAKQLGLGPSYIQQYEVQWRDASGGVVGSTGLQNFAAGTGWSEIAVAGLTAPASAVEAFVFFRFVTGAVVGGFGEVLIDDVVLGGGTGEETIEIQPVTLQSSAVLSWPTVGGTPYQPESTPILQPVSWAPLGGSIVGNGGVRTVTVLLDPFTEYFRVIESVPPDSGVVDLFDSGTLLEPETTVDTPTALITHIADRVRDRHAREGNFMAYDHYLSWYWEQRVAHVEIVDRVARGGSDITFNYTTLDLLNPAEFRTFFRGISTVAEYANNQIATLVSSNPSAIPGETDYNYTATVSQNAQTNAPLQLGDRVEIEISQFLNSPRNGQNNYYGTALLYVVGEGIVPWGQGQDLGFDGGIVGNVNQSLDSYPLPAAARLGGLTTVHYPYSNEPSELFKQTAGNIAPASGHPYMLGRRLHHTDFGDGTHSEPGNPAFVEQAGLLGPDYIARSCVACHVNNGRALPPAVGAPMHGSVVKVGSDAAGTPDPALGSVLQPLRTSGNPEAGVTIGGYTTIDGSYGDGTAYSLRRPTYDFTGVTPTHFSVRLAPQLVGLGLLEAVRESDVAALADPTDADADGISGRMHVVSDPQTGEGRLGRFTYKSGRARVSHQVAAALNTDIGVTTSVFPILDGGSGGATPELSDVELEYMTRYLSALGVRARRDLDDPQALQGETLFTAAGCEQCHTPQHTTSPYHPMAELRSQTIRPYTDLLLHDMGPGLADNMGEGDASGSEWRTAPLWSIGYTSEVSGGEAYLHDGRARTLEEAILWHGGEAEAAKENFRTMSAADRAALVKFLESL